MSNLLGGEQSMLEKLMAAQERIAELEAHANELAATCQARDETIHKHWCKVMELESEVARLRVDGTLLDNERAVNAVSWTLCLQDGCDEDSARNLIWQGQPPEPYGEVWQTYEAKAREVLKAAIDAAKESA